VNPFGKELRMRSKQEQAAWDAETRQLIEQLGWESLGAKVVVKEESKLMRFLDKLLFFTQFMRFYTTIGHVIYAPKGVCPWNVTAHELVHMSDEYDRYGWMYKPMYLLPQILALGAFGAFGAFWNLQFLWCLTSLVFLAPLPSFGRTHLELRGYGMSLAVRYWQAQLPEDRNFGRFDEEGMIDWMTQQFTGSAYYFMCPFKGFVKDRLREILQEAKDGILYSSIPIARQIQEIVQREIRDRQLDG
jgi:hypothetical protein